MLQIDLYIYIASPKADRPAVDMLNEQSIFTDISETAVEGRTSYASATYHATVDHGGELASRCDLLVDSIYPTLLALNKEATIITLSCDVTHDEGTGCVIERDTHGTVVVTNKNENVFPASTKPVEVFL